MAKNKKKKDETSPPDLGDAIRSALERTFHAYTESGERTRAVLDEMAAAAARIRQSMQEAGVADEIAGLRREVEALSQRVAALEAAKSRPAARRTAASSRSSSRPAAAKTRSTAKRAGSTSSRRSTKSAS
jgi:polyhydroxyalkanoate synthesis regulator phasin